MIASSDPPPKIRKAESNTVTHLSSITKEIDAEGSKDGMEVPGSSASESILGMGDDEVSQQESDSQMEFVSVEDEVSSWFRCPSNFFKIIVFSPLL